MSNRTKTKRRTGRTRVSLAGLRSWQLEYRRLWRKGQQHDWWKRAVEKAGGNHERLEKI
jgi:hypothetical protein